MWLYCLNLPLHRGYTVFMYEYLTFSLSSFWADLE